MNSLRNKVQLIGNVGEAPRITNVENGGKRARFSLATNEHYRNGKGEKVQSTQWHNLVAWNKRADIIETYVGKGKEIAIEGRLTSRSYTNEMGVICYITEVVVLELLLLGSKKEEIERPGPIKSETKETETKKPLKATRARKTQKAA